MAQYSKHTNEKLFRQILDFSKHIAGSCQITAACIWGNYALELSKSKATIESLLIIHGFQPRLINYVKVIDNKNVSVVAVDEWVFERDVERGFLGEALAGGLIFPYIVLINGEYLHLQEVELKKRLILELSENLVLDFPEFVYEIRVKPEYFMYEAMVSRARLFPPIFYGLMDFMRERDEKAEPVLNGYLEALKNLEKTNLVSYSEGYVAISERFIGNAQSRKVRFTNLSKTLPRALFTSLLKIFPQILNLFSQNAEILRPHRDAYGVSPEVVHRLVDPQEYLYVPTARGLVSLADRVDIEAFARKVLSPGKDAKVKMKEIGGVLNDVYLIEASFDGNERRAVVKRFRDWSSFKWFPLTLWTIGTRTFAVLGRSRLERECAINKFLQSEGIAVPEVLYVSHSERLVFMEFLEGKSLDKLVKRIANSKTKSGFERDLHVLMKVGELFARVHSLDVSLGDTKPENIMVGPNGEIYLLDLEQASRKGDKVWDVAEFLYYSGHYISPLSGNRSAGLIAKAFINGYLKAGGKANVIKMAGNPRYTRVFSVFTFPPIMFVISNACRRVDKLK